jgi:hypothetical protein
MRRLAHSMPPNDIAWGYGLYVRFRPSVPAGVRGWGAAGQLDISLIRNFPALKSK